MSDLNISEIRRSIGLSQEKFAEILGVHTRTVQNWEKGGKIPKSKYTLLRSIPELFHTQNVYGDGQTTQTGDIHSADCKALMRAMDEITEMRKSFTQALERKDEQISRLIALLENIAPSKK